MTADAFDRLLYTDCRAGTGRGAGGGFQIQAQSSGVDSAQSNLAVGWLLYEVQNVVDHPAAPGRGFPAGFRARLRSGVRDRAEPVRRQGGDRRPRRQPPRRLPADPGRRPVRPDPAGTAVAVGAVAGRAVGHQRLPAVRRGAGPGTADRGRGRGLAARASGTRHRSWPAAQRARGSRRAAGVDRGRRPGRGDDLDRRRHAAAARCGRRWRLVQGLLGEPRPGPAADRRRARGPVPAAGPRAGRVVRSCWTPTTCTADEARGQRAGPLPGRAARRRSTIPTTSSTRSSWPNLSTAITRTAVARRC